MENFKVQNFKRECPRQNFPWYEHLTEDQLIQIVQSFKQLFFKTDIHPKNFLSQLECMPKEIYPIYAGTGDFDLAGAFNKFNIRPNETVYINWYRFDDIDRLKFSDICDFFDYIWYPESDDIEIFDKTFEWVIQITHYGVVSKIRPEK